MNLILFDTRNKSVISLKTVYENSLIYIFALFIISGNFFRIISLFSFGNSLSLIEISLYLFSTPLYFRYFRKSQIILCAIGISTFYGLLLHGWDTPSILYSCKLMAMIISGIAVGEVLNARYCKDPKRGLIFIINIFAASMFVGWIIFLLFPKSELFFIFLSKYGIYFHGDPHQRRFISTFFDPNYYGAIACLPFMLCILLQKYFWASAFFASILFTWSRSGIATFILLFCLLFFLEKMLENSKQFNTKKIKMIILCGIAFLVVLPYFSEEISSFCSRLFHLAEDPSALCRLETFNIGIQYFLVHPFFGFGFAYLAKVLWEDAKMVAIDSSLLFTLINFGLIPTLSFLFISMCGFYNHIRKVLVTNGRLIMKCFFWLYTYLLIIVLFTCQFNHILYYQFWLVPMIALFTFLEEWRKKNETSFCS